MASIEVNPNDHEITCSYWIYSILFDVCMAGKPVANPVDVANVCMAAAYIILIVTETLPSFYITTVTIH